MENNKKKRIAIISIMTYYARQIFDETKLYEFRKSPIKSNLLNEKIYVYSAKEDKAIIGYVKVSDILNGNTNEILKLTGYDKRLDGGEIVDYYGRNNQGCFALKLYDVTEFIEYLTLKEMRSISKTVDMPQYIKFIYEDDPLYEAIVEWDTAFSLDGKVTKDVTKTKQLILEKSRRGRR